MMPEMLCYSDSKSFLIRQTVHKPFALLKSNGRIRKQRQGWRELLWTHDPVKTIAVGIREIKPQIYIFK